MTKCDAITRVVGHAAKIGRGDTYLELLIAIEVAERMEFFNKCLQSKQNTISDMKEVVCKVVNALIREYNTENTYNVIYTADDHKQQEFELDEIALKCQCCPSLRFTGSRNAFHSTIAKHHYKIDYAKV